MDRWTLMAVLFCGFISYSYGQAGCQDSPSAECSLYNSDIICDSQGTHYLWAKENCPLYCGFCQSCQDSPFANCSLYNSNIICDSQGKYYLWAKENCPLYCGFCQGCQDSPSAECSLYNSDIVCDSQGTHYLWAKENCPLYCGFCQGVSTRSTVSTSTGPGETTLKPTFSPGTKETEVGHNVGRDNNEGCGPDISLSFRGGVRDTSGNRAAVDYSGVALVNGTACFDGSSRLYIWRYKSYDYRDKLQISFKFKPTPGPRIEPYTLVSNCEGNDEPSYGIGLNRFSNITTMFLKTDESEDQSMSFDINPTTWTDVYFRYQNGTMIGIVNTEIQTRSLIGNIKKRPDAMVFAHCKQYGNYRGLIKDIVVYSNCLPPLDKHVESYLNGFT
uniref:Asparagine-rich protein-like isoform X2 n=1 Tax=Crassostrea virginica TaxID=6565 RepID=A0A8B8EWN9_CRAVI|nr:asparagine-rich protein-like isoform X2 [Crassostrea virginica]